MICELSWNILSTKPLISFLHTLAVLHYMTVQYWYSTSLLMEAQVEYVVKADLYEDELKSSCHRSRHTGSRERIDSFDLSLMCSSSVILL